MTLATSALLALISSTLVRLELIAQLCHPSQRLAPAASIAQAIAQTSTPSVPMALTAQSRLSSLKAALQDLSDRAILPTSI